MPSAIVVYDGACKFCKNQLKNLTRLSGTKFEAVSFRDDGFFVKYPMLTLEECEKSLQLLVPADRKYSGAEAVFRTVALNPFLRPALWVYYIPGLRTFFEWLYKNISENRYKISRWRRF